LLLEKENTIVNYYWRLKKTVARTAPKALVLKVICKKKPCFIAEAGLNIKP
jgi:hypothetical protein